MTDATTSRRALLSFVGVGALALAATTVPARAGQPDRLYRPFPAMEGRALPTDMTGAAAFQRVLVVSACLYNSAPLDEGSLKGMAMVDLAKMSNLRGGSVYGAAMVAPTTARSWALELGTSVGSGHPRYDVCDVVALIMMRQLTNQNVMAAAQAALIVNTLRPSIKEEVNRVADAQKSEGKWTWEGGKFAVIVRRPEQNASPDQWMKVVNEDQIGALMIDRSSGSTPTVVSILRCINVAFLALERELFITPLEGSGIDVVQGRANG